MDKFITEFHKSRCQKDGYSGMCKSCCAEHKREHRQRHGERLREYDRVRATDPVREEMMRASRKRWRQLHTKKSVVHGVFSYALRLGNIIPQPCWVCGEKAHGHHPDYDRPLDVVWLCPQHHKAAHAAIHIKVLP